MTILVVPAIFLVAFGLGFALRSQVDSRRTTSVIRRGAIGRWHVPPAGSFFHLPSFGEERLTAARWIEGVPACIEFTGIYLARVGSFSRLAAPSSDQGAFVLRFPVTGGAEAVARQALG